MSQRQKSTVTPSSREVLQACERFIDMCNIVGGEAVFDIYASYEKKSGEYESEDISNADLDKVRKVIEKFMVRGYPHVDIAINMRCIITRPTVIPTGKLDDLLRTYVSVDGSGKVVIYRNGTRFDYGKGTIECRFDYVKNRSGNRTYTDKFMTCIVKLGEEHGH